MSIGFYRGADCCILVYDVTCQKSFRNLEIWYNDFLDNAVVNDSDIFPFVLIGNKIDLTDNRIVIQISENNYELLNNFSLKTKGSKIFSN